MSYRATISSHTDPDASSGAIPDIFSQSRHIRSTVGRWSVKPINFGRIRQEVICYLWWQSADCMYSLLAVPLLENGNGGATSMQTGLSTHDLPPQYSTV